MKRRLVTFFRVIGTGFKNFVRNLTLAIAAMAVMVVTLTIVLFSVITNATFNSTISTITDKIDISIFLKDSVTEDQVNGLTDGLKALPNVKSVEYLSKDKVLEAFAAQNADNQGLIDAAKESGNTLPATVHINPRDLNKIEDIQAYLTKPEVAELQSDEPSYSGDRKEAIDKISHATNILQRVGLAAVVLFAAISALIIFNTIQMAIFNRRDEITIMRLLGATTWYIRGPFVVESIIYGVLSAVLSVVIINGAFVAAKSALEASSLGLLDISYANTFFREKFMLLLALQLGIGILLGAASSIIATRRYLKFRTSK